MTERIYLTSLNKDHGAKYSLRFTPGRETDLLNMWRTLHTLMSEAFSSVDGDRAYCICDRDYEAYKLDRIREIKQGSVHDQAKLIVSNPCFEIWFLNHFRFSTRSFGSYQEVKSELRDHIPCYEKNVDYYPSHLRARTAEAINNSTQQIEQAKGDMPSFGFVPDNPGTEIAELVQTIVAN